MNRYLYGNFSLSTANGKRKQQSSICLQEAEIGTGSFFSLVDKL